MNPALSASYEPNAMTGQPQHIVAPAHALDVYHGVGTARAASLYDLSPSARRRACKNMGQSGCANGDVP